MEFLDTQIISYKFKNNNVSFDGDIRGKYISSIVALEFLGIMIPNENEARMYPMKLKGIHTVIPFRLEHRKEGLELGKHGTDKLIIDFNGEFDSIVIYSNEAISYLINQKELDVLLLFAKNALEKEDYKRFRERAQFLVNNNLTVVPISREVVVRMQRIYENIKKEYNVKDNYRNSFMDLLILATALEKKGELISKDNELNKVIAKCCSDINILTVAEGVSYITYREEHQKRNEKSNNKHYINNGWQVMIRKGITY